MKRKVWSNLTAHYQKRQNRFLALLVIVMVAAIGTYLFTFSHAASPYAGSSADQGNLSGPVSVQAVNGANDNHAAVFGDSYFNYGFDFSNQEPDSPPNQNSEDLTNNPAAVASALQIMSKFPTVTTDQSMYGFGASNEPESPDGTYDFSNIVPRIQMITTAGGTPVITLVGAPSWMYEYNSKTNSSACDPDNFNDFFTPPCPAYYSDFAGLAAKIAEDFPQVDHFVVWNEFKGFYNGGNLDAVNYTTMYNDVYNAIKAVRPDAQVGGPYIPFSAYPCSESGTYSKILSGAWGCVPQSSVEAMTYWLANKAGADFVAVDGATEIAKGSDSALTDPVTASEKYAVVDQWIKSQTNLPLWWMESAIQTKSGWTDQQAAAARIATLALMNSSGASVGMQWQPQNGVVSAGNANDYDEGLWTSTLNAGGGQPTDLATDLLSGALGVLQQRLTLVSGQPTGVLVAKSASQTLLINTNSTSAKAVVNGKTISLDPGAVVVQ
jgi:hypothetical protein